MLGVGQVGCGMIGQGHAYALRLLADDGDVRTVAAADRSDEAIERAQQIGRFEHVGNDALAVIEHPEVEAVVIVTPTTTHDAFVRAALDAGKHVLCEKPLATDFATVRSLCDTVAAAPLTTQVGFHSRFHPLFNELRRIVLDGALGRPMGYVLRDDQFWPTGDVVPGHSSWRSERAHSGGGALIEHSIHSADLLSWMFGPPTEVFARSRSVFGYDVEDTVASTISHESGVVGTLLTIFNGVRGREERRLEVFFEHGAVEVTTDFLVGAREDSFLIQRPDSDPERLDVAALREAHFVATGLPRRDFMIYLYPAARSFVHAIRDGAEAAPSFHDALVAHALVEAAYRSAEINAPVALPI